MPNIASLLKSEIVRLARKEIRSEVTTLRKASASHRREIAALKREISALRGKAKALAKQATRKVEATEPATKARFSAKGLHSMRSKLGLSAAGIAKLLGVSQQSVYNWESRKTVPRPSQVTAIAALRSVGKRDAQQRLQGISKKVRRKA